ncbi:MAG TPA: hypothetical protein ENK47_04520 [Euryarchaeota archaeon]|nr:hypothetical protein [Euryarchaeota archaeon]
MWKVLGEKINLIQAGEIWKNRILELSRRKKGRPKFVKMLEEADVKYWFNTVDEVHVFFIKLPASYGSEEVKFMKDFIMKVIRSSADPVIEFAGEPLRYTVVITSEEEEDVYRGFSPPARNG